MTESLQRIAILQGGKIDAKYAKELEAIAHSLGMKVLDMEMLKVGSTEQIQKAIQKCEIIITDEWDPTKVSDQLMVRYLEASKIQKPEYLIKRQEVSQNQVNQMADATRKRKRSAVSSDDFVSGATGKRRKVEEEKKEDTKTALQDWKSPHNKKAAAKLDASLAGFACVTGAPKSDNGDMKAKIIAELEKLLKSYQSMGDKQRVMGYGRAISNIKGYAKPITDPKQMDEIPFIGDGIKKKVKEFMEAGKMTIVETLKADPKLSVISDFEKIWGVGPVAAQKLYQKGVRSVEELRDKQDLLTAFQKIGLKYYDDFQERIPRAMATEISNIVAKTVKSLYGTQVKVETCGSYRRGRPTCGDVDILITRTDDKPVKGMLEPILQSLEKSGFLYERLGNTRLSDKGSEMYMGICKAPKDTHFRRIDIKVYPKEQYGFALLYFTGSDYFNRSMRLFAEKKGYKLSDHGLARVTKTAKGEKVTKDKGISCEVEEDVFKALGLPYKTPAERDI